MGAAKDVDEVGVEPTSPALQAGACKPCQLLVPKRAAKGRIPTRLLAMGFEPTFPTLAGVLSH